VDIENFTGKAEAYLKGRPGYPEAAIEAIAKLIPTDKIIADIGAGTGKFTVELAKYGYRIYAVEPNKDMSKQLENVLRNYSNTSIINSIAESTSINDNSVDVVTIAHALHWFELDAFMQECNRILRPDGTIIVIYNHLPGKEAFDRYRQTVDKFLSKPEIMIFQNQMEYTLEKWHSYIASQEDYPRAGDAGYEKHIADINEDFSRESVNGLIRVDRLTFVYYERIK
jgi:ubiquinone/menaquinone biosynthesis C-methylase UbiE